MNEELFRGLWSRAVDVDEQLSEEAVRFRVRRKDVWNTLEPGPLTSTPDLARIGCMSWRVQWFNIAVPLTCIADDLGGRHRVHDGGVFL